jgi:hypothetical protein
MTAPITPGQVARDTYWRILAAHEPRVQPLDWTHVDPIHQAAWEAAAQAVLEAFVSSAQRLLPPQEEPERATPRKQEWSKAMALLVEQVRQLPHEPDIESELECLWVLLHELRQQEETPHGA